MFTTSQWKNVAPGASGSANTTANDSVPGGMDYQAKGGDTFTPSQVNFTGICAPAANAELDTTNGPITTSVAVGSGVAVSAGVSVGSGVSVAVGSEVAVGSAVAVGSGVAVG